MKTTVKKLCVSIFSILFFCHSASAVAGAESATGSKPVLPQFKAAIKSGTQSEILNLENPNTLAELKDNGFLILVRDSDEFKGMLINPLLLLVRVSPNGDLRLWNEKHGNVMGKTTLSNRLSFFFKEREKAGVFREGTREVEKTVVVNLPPRIKTVIFDKTVEKLRKVGAGPIYLNVIKNGRV